MSDDRNLLTPEEQHEDNHEYFRCPKCSWVGCALWDCIDGYYCPECDEGLYPGHHYGFGRPKDWGAGNLLVWETDEIMKKCRNCRKDITYDVELDYWRHVDARITYDGKYCMDGTHSKAEALPEGVLQIYDACERV